MYLFLPQTRLAVEQVVRIAQAAQTAGFLGLALMDHLVTPQAEHLDLLEAMTVATWVAARTTTLRIGHLVLCDAFRHPAVLAKQAATLAQASGGRFDLGLGWGSWPAELTAFGITDDGPAGRIARLERTLQLLRELWRPSGSARQSPVPDPVPPLVLGGAGPRLLALVREYADWWNLPAPELHRLDELRDQAGPARISVQQMVAFDPRGSSPGSALALAERRFGQLGQGVVGGGLEQLRDHFGSLAERGVERAYFWLPDPHPEIVDELGTGLRC
jgi:alkanesulfonate monooxygenase SsuD/methylene tetrahydromethanopterin reductase-like flavin-dependent oxidoreductase (luciferase family)